MYLYHFSLDDWIVKTETSLIFIQSNVNISVSSESSFWDEYRTSETDGNKSGNSTIVVPAGIDPGKYLEEQLKKVRNLGIGPKQVPK